MASSMVSLKLLIDRKGERVLFAEAGKDFVDFLFTLFTLPIGPVIKLLNNEKDTVGSVNKLYQSILDLHNDHIQYDQQKEVGTKRKYSNSSSSRYDPLPVGDWWPPSPTPTTVKYFYTCDRCTNPLSPVANCICKTCGYMMTKVVTHYVIPTTSTTAPVHDEGFVKGLSRFMIMDDLAVAPWSNISSISLLSKFNIKDVSALEEKDVQISMNEGLKLLKHALGSKTVLTDIFLATKDENLQEPKRSTTTFKRANQQATIAWSMHREHMEKLVLEYKPTTSKEDRKPSPCVHREDRRDLNKKWVGFSKYTPTEEFCKHPIFPCAESANVQISVLSPRQETVSAL
ncbi:hypothetical protein CTI12_AA581210 [Artemisia annua]|uniref:DUF674 domain-containing protein n=1 Tax=Artemisia annua TaxID=35608 RepID=A0A2U1KP11_ARTAN|nr:hypothetical protein CTI12_AA581210 [Artemisia annua]